MYSFEDIKEKSPMKYWAFPANSSSNQKAKFSKAMTANYTLTLKRDGALYRAMIDGENSLLQSRTVSAKTGKFVEKQDNVPTIMEPLIQKLPKGTVLMGEICFPLTMGNTTSSDIVSIMGCLPAKAIARQKLTPVNYYIFDILMYGHEPLYHLPYTKRMERLQQIAPLFKTEPRIEFANPVTKDLDKVIAQYLDNGWEGGVLMKNDEPYTFEKRPAWTSIKVKQSTDTIDLVIMGTTPATKEYTGKYPASHCYWENVKTGELVEGNYYDNGGYLPVSSTYFLGLVGGLQLGAYYGENLIEVARISNLTDEIRQDVTANTEQYFGQVVEVEAMMIDVERKSLRHPKLVKFRPDKNAFDCKYIEIF